MKTDYLDQKMHKNCHQIFFDKMNRIFEQKNLSFVLVAYFVFWKYCSKLTYTKVFF